MKNTKKTIGMVVAMEKEILPLVSELGNEIAKTETCGFKVTKYLKAKNIIFNVVEKCE